MKLEDDPKAFIHDDIIGQRSSNSKHHRNKQVLIKLNVRLQPQLPSWVGPNNIRWAVGMLTNIELPASFELQHPAMLNLCCRPAGRRSSIRLPLPKH
jgi:hypothetical protein